MLSSSSTSSRHVSPRSVATDTTDDNTTTSTTSSPIIKTPTSSRTEDSFPSRSKIRLAFMLLLGITFVVLQNLLNERPENAVQNQGENFDPTRFQVHNNTSRDELYEKRRQRMEERAKRAERRQGGKYVLPANHTLPPDRDPSRPLKVGYPIFVLNLPKTGTTTLWQYFECGLGADRVIHWWTTGPHNKKIGPCVEHNILNGQPPLDRCGHYDVWIDFGYATPTNCFFPAVHGYQALYEAYPHATFLLIPRNTQQWFKSASNWGKGAMLRRWKHGCRKAFFPNLDESATLSNDAFKEFYPRSLKTIRQFAQEHPAMKLVEPPPHITLASPELGSWLEEAIGIEASCWKKCQPHGKDAVCEESNQ